MLRKSDKPVVIEQNGTKTEFSASDLAQTLGVERQRITKLRARPGAPEISDVPGWKRFLEERGRNGVIKPSLTNKIAEQRLRVATATADKVERDNAIRRGELIPASEVNRVALAVYSFFFGELDRQRQTWPALFKGRTELEIYEVIQADNLKIKTGLMARLKEFLK